jgi:hypothetical protein
MAPMSDVIDRISRDQLLVSPYASGEQDMVRDLIQRSEPAMARVAAHRDVVSRALANQTTLDNPALLPTPIANQARVKAEAPALAALATVVQSLPKLSQVAGWMNIPVVDDPPEKAPVWSPATGSAATTVATMVSAAAWNLSVQVEDWGEGDPSTNLPAAVLARMETRTLTALGTGGTAAADLAAALQACQPAPTHVVGNIGGLVDGAALLAQLATAGLPIVAIATTNYPDVLVLCRPAIVLDITAPQLERVAEPGVMGWGVASWVYGRAAVPAGATSAVQRIAATP